MQNVVVFPENISGDPSSTVFKYFNTIMNATISLNKRTN